MPRGVYDRSKMKKKAAKAETPAAEAPKAKRKYTRRAQGVAHQGIGQAPAASFSGGSNTLFTLRELVTLKQIGAPLDSLIKKVSSKLEQEWDESHSPTEVAPKLVKANGKAKEAAAEEPKQTALPAPVPFIPQPATPA